MSDFQRLACPCTEKLHTDLGEVISDEGADVFPNTCNDDARMAETTKTEDPACLDLDPKNLRFTLIIIPCTKHPDVKVRYVMCVVNLEQAIAIRKESLRKAASDSSQIALHMSSLARFRHLFFLVTSRNEFLAYAISGLGRCLRTLQMDDYHRAMHKAEMGVYHHSSFHHFGAGLESISDMIKSIQCLRDAIGLLPEESPTALASYLDRELPSLLLCQFRHDPHEDILEDAAIARLRERVDLPMDLRCRSSSLKILTDILMSRFESNQSAVDLDDAIAYHEKVLRLLPDVEMDYDGAIKCTDTKSEMTLDALTCYSTFLCTRFGQTGALKLTDLETAMYWAEFVARRIPEDCYPQTKRRRENCLVNCLMQRYQADGQVEDISRAVDLIMEWSDWSYYVDSIRQLLLIALDRAQDRGFIDGAIQFLEKALSYNKKRQNVLGNYEAMTRRHLGRSEIAVIHEAMERQPSLFSARVRRPGAIAIPRLNIDWVYISVQHDTLGRALTLKYESSQLRREDDIQKALRSHERAISMAPPTSHLHQQYLVSAGTAYRVRFDKSGNHNREDIIGALTRQRRALNNINKLSRSQPPFRVQALRSLAHSYLSLASFDSNASAFATALELFREAVNAEYGFVHDRLSVAVDWAMLVHDTKIFGAKSKSSELLEEAANTEYGFLRDRLSTTVDWERRSHNIKFFYLLQEKKLLTSALEGYEHSISLLVQATMMSVTTSSRLAQLCTVPRSLASDAAACAFRLAEVDPENAQAHIGKAVELLDQGRAIMWSQAARLRQEIKRLEHENAGLAADLGTILQDQFRASLDGDSYAHSGEAMQSAASHWKDLLSKVRQIPGFSDFLSPMRFDRLRHAANEAPIIIVNASEYGCDAVIVLPEGDLQVIHLSNLRKGDIDSDVSDLLEILEFDHKDRRRRFPQIMEGLWFNLCKPILESPAFKKAGLKKNPNNPAQVRWCPTGKLAFLPIHAACPRNGATGMLDYVVSSYITTLSTVLRSQETHQRSSYPVDPTYPRVLAVCHSGISHPGYEPLTHVQNEVNLVRKHAGGKHVNVLPLEHANSSNVLSELERSDWVHFACHGTQNVTDPMESALLLQDGPMPISMIGDKSFSGEFAMLLACETAMGLPGLSDEAIHIAAALHFAGFKSIVATMWRIQDEKGKMVADSVYGYIFNQEPKFPRMLAPGEAAHALRHAQLKLRDEKKLNPQDWAPFIHYGL